MRYILIILAVLLVGFAIWRFAGGNTAQQDTSEKQTAIAVSKHSDAFNNSIGHAMDVYYTLTDDFVKWDSSAVNSHAAELVTALDNLQLQEIKDSSGIYETAETFINNAKNDLSAIQSRNDLTEKRHSLNSLTDNLFNLLRVVRYDREKLYLQECPMAFNDDEAGLWLSKDAEIRNPYLGLHHPRYGKGMLNCGETKETLNYTGDK